MFKNLQRDRSAARVLVLCLAWLAVACSDDDEDDYSRSETDIEASCKDKEASDLDLVVDTGDGERPLDRDLLVNGRATQAHGLAIRSVLVDGLPATKDSFNYSSWSATLSIDRLLSRRDDEGNLSLSVVATDACGTSATETIAVKLLAPVRSLSIDVDLPGSETFVPADGRTSAVITLTSNPEAAGASVDVVASGSGTFVGLVNGQVTLGGNKSEPSSASILFTATQPGTVFVTATAQGQVTSTPILVAGPLAILPNSGDLSPGQSLSATVNTAGRIESCQATPAAGLTVVANGQDISEEPATFEDNETPVLVVTAADDLDEERTIKVTCRDPFGQTGTATFSATP